MSRFEQPLVTVPPTFSDIPLWLLWQETPGSSKLGLSPSDVPVKTSYAFIFPTVRAASPISSFV
jgi:hypothetical protein